MADQYEAVGPTLFLAHSIIGWVLAAILVAAITVITSTGLK